jgi:very-short-patch-repair endonuclease
LRGGRGCVETQQLMKRKIIPYKPYLKELARNLRNNSTLSEIILWKNIKGKQMLGYDFHRQKPLGNYIVDFFCNELMLAIEIDGSSHHWEGVYEKDQKRQREIEEYGVRFLRFEDISVKKNIQMVLEVIVNWIEENAKDTPPCPPLKRGRHHESNNNSTN